MRVWMARGLVLGALGEAAYGFWQGTPMSDEAARDLIETLETTPR